MGTYHTHGNSNQIGVDNILIYIVYGSNSIKSKIPKSREMLGIVYTTLHGS